MTDFMRVHDPMNYIDARSKTFSGINAPVPLPMLMPVQPPPSQFYATNNSAQTVPANARNNNRKQQQQQQQQHQQTNDRGGGNKRNNNNNNNNNNRFSRSHLNNNASQMSSQTGGNSQQFYKNTQNSQVTKKIMNLLICSFVLFWIHQKLSLTLIFKRTFLRASVRTCSRKVR